MITKGGKSAKKSAGFWVRQSSSRVVSEQPCVRRATFHFSIIKPDQREVSLGTLKSALFAESSDRRIPTDQRFSVHLSTALAFAPAAIIGAFLPIHLRWLNASFSLISLVYLIPAIENIVLSPLWGGLLDKTGKGQQIILVSLLAVAVEFSTFPFLTTPEEFVIVVSVTGVFTASFIPVFSSIATWASHQYGRAIGGFWTAASLGYGSATLLGGIVYEFYNATYLFVLGAVLGYAGCLAVVLLNKQGFTSTTLVKASRGYGNILTLCIISILAIVATSSFNTFFTVYLVVFLKASRLVAGLAATGTTFLGAVAFRFVGPLNDTIGRKPVFILGTVGYVLYFMTIYLVSNALVVTVLWVLPIYPLIRSSAAALVSDYTSQADRGKGLGFLESAISLGGGVGPLAGGLIADRLELRAVTIFSLAVALTSTIASQLFLKERRQPETLDRVVQAQLPH